MAKGTYTPPVNDPDFYFAVKIIHMAHHDYKGVACKEEHKQTAIEFFHSDWYVKLYEFCSLFVDSSHMMLLNPPEGIINERIYGVVSKR